MIEVQKRNRSLLHVAWVSDLFCCDEFVFLCWVDLCAKFTHKEGGGAQTNEQTITIICMYINHSHYFCKHAFSHLSLSLTYSTGQLYMHPQSLYVW